MKIMLELLLPSTAGSLVRGAMVPVDVFILVAVLSIVRSCIHLLAPDGGAGSIAGMDLLVSAPAASSSRCGAATGNYVALPLAAPMLVWSLWSATSHRP